MSSSSTLNPVRALRWTLVPLTLQWMAPAPRPRSYRVRAMRGELTSSTIITTRPTVTITDRSEGDRIRFFVSAVSPTGESDAVATPPLDVPPAGLVRVFSHLQMGAGLALETGYAYLVSTALARHLGASTDLTTLFRWMLGLHAAWTWVAPSSARLRVRGTQWGWDWTAASPRALTDAERLAWFTLALQELDALLFRQRDPFVVFPVARMNTVKIKGQWATWWKRCTAWLSTVADTVAADPVIPEWRSDVPLSEEATDTTAATEEANAWFWSTSTEWLPWIWLSCEAARRAPSLTWGDTLLDVVGGMERARRAAQTASWIVGGASPRALYATIWETMMNSLSAAESAAESAVGGVVFPSQLGARSYGFVTGATPFSEETDQVQPYGVFRTPDGTTLVYSSWSDLAAGARRATRFRGEANAACVAATRANAEALLTPAAAPFTPAAEPYRILARYLTSVPSSVQALVQEAIQILQSVIVQSHGLRLPSVSLEADMIVDISTEAAGPSVLAYSMATAANTSVSPAMPLRQSVTLNSTRFATLSTDTATLNGRTVSALVPVLLHEMLHGIGIASYVTGSTVVGWDGLLDDTKTWYVGRPGVPSEAIRAYQRAVQGIATGGTVNRIPVENSFGAGTAYSHWEEGLRDGFLTEKRYYTEGGVSVYYPALPSEIMSGIAGRTYYFSDITAGALADRGYVVERNSPAVVPYPSAFLS